MRFLAGDGAKRPPACTGAKWIDAGLPAAEQRTERGHSDAQQGNGGGFMDRFKRDVQVVREK
jgi:hypothetical protein